MVTKGSKLAGNEEDGGGSKKTKQKKQSERERERERVLDQEIRINLNDFYQIPNAQTKQIVRKEKRRLVVEER